jgi:hypothetical protein
MPEPLRTMPSLSAALRALTPVPEPLAALTPLQVELAVRYVLAEMASTALTSALSAHRDAAEATRRAFERALEVALDAVIKPAAAAASDGVAGAPAAAAEMDEASLTFAGCDAAVRAACDVSRELPEAERHALYVTAAKRVLTDGARRLDEERSLSRKRARVHRHHFQAFLETAHKGSLFDARTPWREFVARCRGEPALERMLMLPAAAHGSTGSDAYYHFIHETLEAPMRETVESLRAAARREGAGTELLDSEAFAALKKSDPRLAETVAVDERYFAERRRRHREAELKRQRGRFLDLLAGARQIGPTTTYDEASDLLGSRSAWRDVEAAEDRIRFFAEFLAQVNSRR